MRSIFKVISVFNGLAGVALIVGCALLAFSAWRSTGAQMASLFMALVFVPFAVVGYLFIHTTWIFLKRPGRITATNLVWVFAIVIWIMTLPVLPGLVEGFHPARVLLSLAIPALFATFFYLLGLKKLVVEAYPESG